MNNMKKCNECGQFLSETHECISVSLRYVPNYCSECGVLIKLRNDTSLESYCQRKYCSWDCHHRFLDEHRPTKKCPICDSSFTKPIGIGNKTWGRRKYCSNKCYSTTVSDRNLDEKHPNWKGGKAKYRTKRYVGMEYRRWRTSVFERDNYICQECGDKNGNGKTVYLEAHHIRPVRSFPELEYEIDNGITYCRQCHALKDNFRKLGGKLWQQNT